VTYRNLNFLMMARRTIYDYSVGLQTSSVYKPQLRKLVLVYFRFEVDSGRIRVYSVGSPGRASLTPGPRFYPPTGHLKMEAQPTCETFGFVNS
jgi:hypothetical protein